MSQPLFHAGQYGLVVTGVDVDHAVWHQARLGDCRGEQVASGQAPQNLPPRACGNAGAEQGRGCAIDRSISTACHFVERTER